jgi:CheY-like chemotaxis protein
LYKAALLQPDMIITDLEMPHLDGFTLTQLLFIIGIPLPIIISTTSDDVASVRPILKLQSVYTLLDKGVILKEKERFLQKIDNCLSMTPDRLYQITATFAQGALSLLQATGTGRGLFKVEFR